MASGAGVFLRVETRANAFAIAFLAPPAAVREIVKLDIPVEEQVGRLMQHFGLAASAARYHLSNVAREWGVDIDTTHDRTFHDRVLNDEEARTRRSSG